MIKHPPIPGNFISLHLFYFLISNQGFVLPYEIFTEITPAFSSRAYVSIAVGRLRPLIEMHGYYVLNLQNRGYKCMKSFDVKELFR